MLQISHVVNTLFLIPCCVGHVGHHNEQSKRMAWKRRNLLTKTGIWSFQSRQQVESSIVGGLGEEDRGRRSTAVYYLRKSKKTETMGCDLEGSGRP